MEPGQSTVRGIRKTAARSPETTQHRLGLRVAEPAVELQDLRAVGGQHEANIEDAAILAAFGRHSGDGRPDDRLEYLSRSSSERAKAGEWEPIPPVLGPVSPSPTRL